MWKMRLALHRHWEVHTLLLLLLLLKLVMHIRATAKSSQAEVWVLTAKVFAVSMRKYILRRIARYNHSALSLLSAAKSNAQIDRA